MHSHYLLIDISRHCQGRFGLFTGTYTIADTKCRLSSLHFIIIIIMIKRTCMKHQYEIKYIIHTPTTDDNNLHSYTNLYKCVCCVVCRVGQWASLFSFISHCYLSSHFYYHHRVTFFVLFQKCRKPDFVYTMTLCISNRGWENLFDTFKRSSPPFALTIV